MTVRAQTPAAYLNHGIGLQPTAGQGGVALWEPAGMVPWLPPAAKPIPGLPLEALRRVSDPLACELGAPIRTAALCSSCPTKVQMPRQTSVPPQQGCGPAAGMAVRRLAASSPDRL